VSPANTATTPHLILGGARSGKSTYAESIITALPPPYMYIATAQILDDEMRARVRAHRNRRNTDWETIEAPFNLIEALRASNPQRRPVLVDCLTLWLSNLILGPSPLSPPEAVQDLCDLLPTLPFPVLLVSNEVGTGIVPDNALARQFRDLAGTTNQKVALACSSVTMVVAGLPLRLK
jgi:adenosylcobinamide kinase/adenosylcobinamide-phosphate guanylyltransferase